jgi:5-methylcytosine-specific restriction endonuclease McrA
MAEAEITRTCAKHGRHSDWSVRKPHGHHKATEWRCRPCDRERYQATKAQPWRIDARHKAYAKEAAARQGAREKYRAAVHAALLDTYGSEVAAYYKAALLNTPPSEKKSVTVQRVIRAFVQERYPWLTPGNVERVFLLNRVTTRPLVNLGWSCATCFIESDDCGFFDVDHIVPCAQVGRRVMSDKSNLQVLCPNCHRCKTLGLASWFESTSVAAAS